GNLPRPLRPLLPLRTRSGRRALERVPRLPLAGGSPMRLLLLLCACALAASAQEVRVERRLLVKEKHFFASLGAAWFDRSDYFVSPGAALSVAYYPIESGGPEVRYVRFFSSLKIGRAHV